MKTFPSFINNLVVVTAIGLVALQPSIAKEDSADKSAKTSAKAKSKTASKTSTKSGAKSSDKKAEEAPAEEVAEETVEKAPEVDPLAEHKAAVKETQANLELLDAKLAELEEISTSSSSMVNSRKNRVESTLSRIDDGIEELSEIYKEYKAMKDEPYEFATQTDEERFAYTIKGEAAYKEMMKDMKSKSITTKMDGLNKFDIFSEEFQGITDYQVAAELYSKIVHLMYERWSEVYEEGLVKRGRMSDSRMEEAEDAENKEFVSFGRKGKDKGIDINKDWFNPIPTNLRMLKILTAKAKRFLDEEAKRAEDFAEDDDTIGIGGISPMIVEFWEKMEAVKLLVQAAKYEDADKMVKEEPIFNTLIKINRNIFPEEYSSVLREEVRALESDIRRRQNEERSFQNSISRKNNLIVRDSEYASSQVLAVIAELDKDIAQAKSEADAPEETEEEAEAMSAKKSKK